MIGAWLAVVAGAAVGCTPGGPTRPPPVDPSDAPHSALADEDVYKPSYGKPELQRALIAERGLEATGERRIAELLAQQAGAAPGASGGASSVASGVAPGVAPSVAIDDQLRVAEADLAVRRRFIATLEACEASGRLCPPRLDDPPWPFDPDPDQPAPPPMTAALRFDLDSWRGLAGELHGRACACRSLACVDSVGVAIDQLETRPMPEVQGDDAATVSITRARECLFRLRGKAPLPAAPAPEE